MNNHEHEPLTYAICSVSLLCCDVSVWNGEHKRDMWRHTEKDFFLEKLFYVTLRHGAYFLFVLHVLYIS